MSNTTIKTQQTNQLPAGYKQTAVGIIPEDWEVERLEKLGKVITGNTPSRSDLELWNGNFCWATAKDFKGKYIYDTNEKISDKGSFGARMLPSGSILITCIASIGNNAISKVPLATNQQINSIIVNDKNYNEWLYYQLEFFKSKMIQLAGKTAVPIINKSDFEKIKLPIPPLPEQQKIAEILSTWDNAIDNCKKIIKKLKKRNKGLAQQLLTGKTRVKGFEYTKWENKRLKDIALRVTAKNEELNDTVVTISAQRGFVLQEDFFNKRVASDTLLNYYLLKKGQFAYNKSYSNGYPMGAFKRLDNFEKAVVTTLYICFELKKNVDSDFMNYFFENGMMVNYLMKVAQEGGRAHGLLNIGLDDFFNLKLTIPSKDEQEKIANILDNATNELKQYEQKLANLQLQKKGLMQQLLTGKVRVKLNK